MKCMKRALITGITGQDGSYLAELLLEKGYEVHGIVRHVALENRESRFSRIFHLLDRLILHEGDITNYPGLWRIVSMVRPEEVYHLAAVASIPASFEDEFGTFTTNALGTHYLLATVKDLVPRAHFYFAGTSDFFGKVSSSPQDEHTPFNPTSPYGISKIVGFYLTKLYREAHGLFACSGITFSHESPRRGFEFVTKKITSSVAKIKAGKEKELRLGNLDAKRDWGFAGDYVRAMWSMLQAEKPDDYVIGTGETHAIREFVEAAFAYAGLDWKRYVVVDQSLFRPIEAHEWKANTAKIQAALGWYPTTMFADLVRMMVESDLKKQETG